jgi:uncharacterized protein (TIGR03083 family)
MRSGDHPPFWLGCPAMDAHLQALRASAARLRTLVTPLDDRGLANPAYPSEWSIADVLSHLGSGALISRRRLEDAIAGRATPDDFAKSVWNEWNGKSQRAKVDDGLAADQALVERFASLTPDESEQLVVSIGPLELDATKYVAMRLNEHTLHTWDVEVALDEGATLPTDAAALVVDNLELIARFTAKPTGAQRSITVRTTEPARGFVFELTPDAATMTLIDAPANADLTMPAEAFIRLIYGRLDPRHTPAIKGDVVALDSLRQTYPGP